MWNHEVIEILTSAVIEYYNNKMKSDSKDLDIFRAKDRVKEYDEISKWVHMLRLSLDDYGKSHFDLDKEKMEKYKDDLPNNRSKKDV